MNILIINCSPVRNGATADIVNLVKEHVEEGNVVKSVCIDDYDIKLCKGCRKCHETAKCFQEDDVDKLMVTYDWADKIVSVSPSYWADIPGQFKVFIDRCTPWCNTHQPHAKIKSGKKGYTIALRTGPSMPECERIISSMGNLGHSIVKQKNDRIYIEKGNKSKLDDVALFTFEPHISISGSKYGYKRENIYYFEDGRIKEL